MLLCPEDLGLYALAIRFDRVGKRCKRKGLNGLAFGVHPNVLIPLRHRLERRK